MREDPWADPYPWPHRLRAGDLAVVEGHRSSGAAGTVGRVLSYEDHPEFPWTLSVDRGGESIVEVAYEVRPATPEEAAAYWLAAEPGAT